MYPPEPSAADQTRNRALQLPAEVGLDDAERYVESLRLAESLDFDWRLVQRIDRVAGAIVSSALIGSLGESPVRVRLPDSPHARLEVLSRSGLLFALTHRPGPVEHDGGRDFARVLQTWRGAAAYMQLSWDASKSIGGRETGPRSHAWTNLHRGMLNYSGDKFGGSLKAWLELDVLQSRAKRLAEPLLEDISFVSSEILENIIEHASGETSLAHATITEGGTGSHDRLYLAMQDNGRGIESTARPKLVSSEVGLPGAQLLKALVEGTLATFPASRGRGLPTIWQIVRRNDAAMHVVTGNLRITGKSGRLISGTSAGFVEGTTLVLMFPLLG